MIQQMTSSIVDQYVFNMLIMLLHIARSVNNILIFRFIVPLVQGNFMFKFRVN